MPDMTLIDRYADLIVKVGANVQPGQTVFVTALVEHAPLARALSRAGYAAGARVVDVRYVDNHVRRAFIEHAPDDALSETAPWVMARADALEGSALIMIAGDPDPELFADLDQERVGKARAVEAVTRQLRAQNELKVNWTIAAYPTEGQAAQVFTETDGGKAPSISSGTRSRTPCASTKTIPSKHGERTRRACGARCKQLDALELDALHFSGPGTDLMVGLLPGARFTGGGLTTVDGITHVANLPTEEVFACPDWRRTEGTVRSTRPLQLGGTIVRDLEMRFEGGDAGRGEGLERRRAVEGQMASTSSRSASARSRSSTAPRASARRAHVLRQPLRRERDLPHRLRIGRHVRDRRGRGPVARGDPGTRRERLGGPHGLHDRRPRGCSRRDHPRRDAHPHPQGGHMAAELIHASRSTPSGGRASARTSRPDRRVRQPSSSTRRSPAR